MGLETIGNIKSHLKTDEILFLHQNIKFLHRPILVIRIRIFTW